MAFISEFKTFIARGNVIDLAIGVIIGAAFGKIVAALTDKILMPLVGIFMGGLDFKTLIWQVGSAKLLYGEFLQAILDFILIAFVLFVIVKIINAHRKKEAATAPPAPPAPSNEEKLLRGIRDLLRND